MAYLKRCIFFIIAFWGAWQLSVLFEVHPHVSAFYIPPGLSVAFITVYGWRYIPVIFIAAILSAAPDILPWELQETDLLHSLRQTVAYGIAGYIFHKVWLEQSQRFSLRSATALFSIALGASFVSAIFAHQIFDVFELVPAEALGSIFLSFWGGDFAGVMLTTPLAVILIERQIKQNQVLLFRKISSQSVFQLIWPQVACVAFSGVVALWPHYLGVDVDLENLAVIPVIVIALVFGVPSGILATMLSGGSLLAAHLLFGTEFLQAVELQLLLGLFASLALIAGGAHDDKELARQTRDEANRLAVEAKEEAQAASRAKSQFLSNMSHELRTPLNAIMGFSQMLEYNPKEPLTDTQQQNVNIILKSGGYLLRLIEDLLELSKIDAGPLLPNIENVPASDIIGACLPQVQFRAVENNVKIIDATSANDDLLLWTDKTRLMQVLLNLLSNAIKYNRVGGTVTLSCQQIPNHMLRISVADTGEGIPKEKQDQLFLPFDRLGREAGPIEGSGIGLTISKKIVDLLKGKIGFESELGRGSTFWVDIPMSEKQNTAAVAAKTANSF